MEKVGKSGPLAEIDLEFLGYHDVEKMNSQDFGLQQQLCRVFKTRIRAGIAEDIHWFIYLLTGCRDEDIRNVESAVLDVRSIFEEEKCYIVIPESMSGRKALKRLEDKGLVYVFENLMWEKVQQAFSEYIQDNNERIKNLQAEYYVEPQVEDGSGNTLSLKNLSGMFSGEGTDGSVVVIKADAGVGKTTLAAKIASELADRWEKSRVMPLFIRGQTNWRELYPHALFNTTNLGDILITLLGDGGFPLRQIEQLTRIMQLGYFAFIFDGFDELTKPSDAPQFWYKENFDWLASIAKDSNTRIMLTTRPSFWNREITESTAKKHRLLYLKPFNSKNISEYFNQYFSHKENSDDFTHKAKQFYSELKKSQGKNVNEDSFFNLPASAMMIAHQIEKGGDADFSMTDKNEQHDPSRQLFLQILRRENIRQQTDTKVETMHQVFENIAITSNEFELDDIASDPKCEIQPNDIGKIANHAFLQEINNRSGKFIFKTDFLLHYLQASHIHRVITGQQDQFFQDEYQRNKDLRTLVEIEAEGRGHLIERVAHMLDMPDMDKVASLHNACIGKKFKHVKSFLFHIIAKTVISRRRDENRRERGDIILSLLGDGKTKCVANLCVRGALIDIYLSGWEIRDSIFINFSLSTRKTRDNLQFTNCEFFGNLALPNTSRIENCSSDGAAKLFLNQIGAAEITEENIREDLELALGRFWFPGRLRARTISEDDWKTGKTTIIEQSYRLLEILQQADVIEKHKHYPRLQIKTDAIHDVKEFIENGIIQRRVQIVLKRMKDKIHTAK